MSLTVAEVKDLLEISSTGHDTAIAALLPLVTVQINDYCGGAFSHQVKEEEVTFTAVGSTNTKTLTHNPVIRKSVYVTSTDRGTVYIGDAGACELPIPSYLLRGTTNIEEYALDYEGGRIYIPTSDSSLTSTSSVYVTYSFVDLVAGGKIAASRVIQQHYVNPVGIGSESVGSLSRSYSGGMSGFDSYTMSILAPYKRPRLV